MSVVEEIVSPIIEQEAAKPGFLMGFLKQTFDFVFSIVKMGVMFTVCSVGMVYFKQEGMLYHPAVPEPKYRYPRNMPPGFRHPGEHNLEYDDC